MKKIGYLFGILSTICSFSQSASTLNYKFDSFTAFVNAKLYVDYSTIIDSGTLIIHKGKVYDYGKKIKIPVNAQIVECGNKVIYPSFIDIFTDYGVGEVKSNALPKPHYETSVKGAFNRNQAIKPEINAVELFKNDLNKAKIFRDLGFGAVLTSNSDGIMRGNSCVVLLGEKSENEQIIKTDGPQVWSFNKGSSTQEYPSSLMGSVALIRQTLYDAQWYNTQISKQTIDLSLESLNKINSNLVIFDAANALNSVRALNIAQEFKIPMILHSNGDEYQYINELSKSNSHLIVNLNFPEAYKISNPEDARILSNTQLLDWYLSPYNIKELVDKNVSFSLTTNKLKDAKDFSKNLKKVFETGVSEETILKALTTNPAKQLQIDSYVGSLHKGKLANFLICDNSLSSAKFSINQNWVNGIMYEVNSQPNTISGKYVYRLSDTSTLFFEITNNTQTLEVKCTYKDSIKIPAKIEFVKDQIQIVINLSKLKLGINEDLFLKTNEINTKLKGIISSISGKYDKEFEAIKVDTNITSVINNTKTIFQPKVSIPVPFSSYGRTETFSKTNNYLITNATIWTGEEEFELKNYSLAIINGKIVKIAKDINPKLIFGNIQYKTIDANQKYITAGIIDEHSHIAINGGVNEVGESVTSEVRIKDIINPSDINIYRQLAGGVTTAHVLHGSANCIGGQSALINLKWGEELKNLFFVNNPPFIKFALGENVKQSNWGDKYCVRYPQSRMGVEQTIIDAFQRALEYKNLKQESFTSNKFINMPKVDLELEAIQEILEKKRFITCHSYSQSEINMLMKVAEMYNIRVNTFTHILEGYKISDKLKKHGAGASSFSDWWSFKAEVKDAVPHNAALLTKAGVVTAINSDDPELGRRLNMEAAKGVKYGNLSEAEAWKLVTLNPAKLLQIDKYVGSVKEGKNANLVLWSAKPLSVYAKAEKVLIDGMLYFDENEHQKLEANNVKIRSILIEELLKDKSPEIKKQEVLPEIKEHYHCDNFNENKF